MYYVYILFSKKLGKKYIGRTNDLRSRLRDHSRGDSSFTNRGKPWKLIYYEAFLLKNDATKEELFLKSGQGRERLKYLLDRSLGEVA